MIWNLPSEILLLVGDGGGDGGGGGGRLKTGGFQAAIAAMEAEMKSKSLGVSASMFPESMYAFQHQEPRSPVVLE